MSYSKNYCPECNILTNGYCSKCSTHSLRIWRDIRVYSKGKLNRETKDLLALSMSYNVKDNSDEILRLIKWIDKNYVRQDDVLNKFNYRSNCTTIKQLKQELINRYDKAIKELEQKRKFNDTYFNIDYEYRIPYNISTNSKIDNNKISSKLKNINLYLKEKSINEYKPEHGEYYFTMSQLFLNNSNSKINIDDIPNLFTVKKIVIGNSKVKLPEILNYFNNMKEGIEYFYLFKSKIDAKVLMHETADILLSYLDKNDVLYSYAVNALKKPIFIKDQYPEILL